MYHFCLVIGVLLSRYRIYLVLSRDHDFSHVTAKRERMACRECAFVANQPLIIKRVTELFDNLADYKFMTKAAVNATGGEVYIFKSEARYDHVFCCRIFSQPRV